MGKGEKLPNPKKTTFIVIFSRRIWRGKVWNEGRATADGGAQVQEGMKQHTRGPGSMGSGVWSQHTTENPQTVPTGQEIPWGSEPPKPASSVPLGRGLWDLLQGPRWAVAGQEDSPRNQPWLPACTYPLAPSPLLIGMQFPSLHPEDSLDPLQETHPIQHRLKFQHVRGTLQVKCKP